MLKPHYKNLAEFWPYYLTQHTQPLNRRLHFWGTNNLFFWLVLGLYRRNIKLLIFAVISSYAYAWIGHFFIERNKPATLEYPILSALGELNMYVKTWQGEIDAEIARYVGDASMSQA